MRKTIHNMLHSMLDMTYRMGELDAHIDGRLDGLVAARDRDKARLLKIVDDVLQERDQCSTQ